MEQVQHQMVLVQTHGTGVDEWLCIECGRRFLMSYPPKYKRIVLVPGDEHAAHSGGKGGLQMGGVQVAPAAEDLPAADHAADTGADVPLDDEALRPWLRWLEESDQDEAA
jgi:hypothetical protein